MNWKAECMGTDSEVLEFAAEELRYYWDSMEIKPEAQHEISDFTIRLEVCDSLEEEGLLAPSNSSLDDQYVIDVSLRGGRIAGINERSVLIGAYAWLQGIGWRFLQPGRAGQLAPVIREGRQLCMQEKKSASLRHRGVCIEGANSLENITDFIDWLPKMGYNCFFLQFQVPYTFLARWYHHEKNPKLPPEPFDMEDAMACLALAKKEMKKRGLLLHQVGHGWTGEILGFPSVEWKPVNGLEGAADHEKMAMLSGRRELFCGIPMNTNLCYAKEKVKEEFAALVASYAREHSNIDFLHVWLADEYNNVCECPACQNEILADQYIRILNLADKKLTAMRSPVKIVFLLYQELLWPPVKEKFHNPERFVMMFAPISRTFEQSYEIRDSYGEIPKYVRNHISLPIDLDENMKFLRAWQKLFYGDSFVYDYPLGRAHYGDFGYVNLSRVISRDIACLEQMGLNGYVSCQELRAFLPNALPNYIMGKRLFDLTRQQEELEEEYFKGAYGSSWKQALEYLEQVSDLCQCDYFNGKGSRINMQVADQMQRLFKLIEEYRELITENSKEGSGVIPLFWKRLAFHQKYMEGLGAALFHLAKGDRDKANEKWRGFLEWIDSSEMEMQQSLDVYRVSEVSEKYTGFTY